MVAFGLLHSPGPPALSPSADRPAVRAGWRSLRDGLRSCRKPAGRAWDRPACFPALVTSERRQRRGRSSSRAAYSLHPTERANRGRHAARFHPLGVAHTSSEAHRSTCRPLSAPSKSLYAAAPGRPWGSSLPSAAQPAHPQGMPSSSESGRDLRHVVKLCRGAKCFGGWAERAAL
jgi:hypothetical protein